MKLSNLYNNYITSAVLRTTVDQKGDLLVADEENSVVRLPAGEKGWILTLDTASESGLSWKFPNFEQGFKVSSNFEVVYNPETDSLDFNYLG